MAGSHGANLQHQPMARQRPCEWCHSLRWQRFCPRHTTHSTMGTLCSDKHQLKMWHDTPSDILEEILQRLPVKSLIRFRCVSKQWKSLIDSSKFIQDHSSYQHHLLARYKLESESGLECECFSIINNDNIDVFANEKSSLTLPLFLSSCEYIHMYNSVNGFLCFQGYNSLDTLFAVFWNPTVGKSVSFKFPNGFWSYNSIGFGVCPDTFYPKLVSIKINDSTSRWEVGIFTLSSHAWKEVYKLYRPIRKCYLTRDHVCIKRRIYWLGFYFNSRGGGSDTNVIVSFDLKSEKFGKVRLPDRLLFTRELRVTEVNGSLGVIEYIDDVGYGVWMMEFFTKSFTKMFTVKIPNELRYYDKVFEFRRNGDNKSKLEA